MFEESGLKCFQSVRKSFAFTVSSASPVSVKQGFTSSLRCEWISFVDVSLIIFCV